ncbi:hypothetical protein AYJ57_17370 [Salipiger sp. CCB-MM3]|uniref:hypothetical protein n=1 Tax=Salipiger sp. CCB-MM3 TaxID=1792508 RepID=UPI00080AB692|nr:hypothetical protein [Salipiger sp. CCB-MM3]ANT62197.1 hypothetical protein AYJ57_17370 [Salipiger sp. CCB-MM3]
MRNNALEIAADHPHAGLPHLWQATFAPPPLADPEDPHKIIRTRLKKADIGKSSGTCRVAFLTRLHRRAAVQEFWCASFEEAQVYLNIAGHPDVINFKEQLTTVPFRNLEGRDTFTRVDAHVLLRNGEEVLVSVKYDEKARRKTYLQEVENIAVQTPVEVADRFAVASRYLFHPNHRSSVEAIHKARRGWDPEADEAVLEIAKHLGERFTFQDIVDASGLRHRGHRAVIRLVGDGDIRKDLLDPFSPETELWSAAA